MLEPTIPYRSHICRQFLLNCRQFDHQEENCLQIRGKCLLSGIVGSIIPGFCKTAQDSRSVAYILESSIFMELTYPHKLGVAFGYFVSYQMFLLKVFLQGENKIPAAVFEIFFFVFKSNFGKQSVFDLVSMR